MYKTCDFLSIILKIFRPLQFVNNFNNFFKTPAKTNTIFHHGKKCGGRFVDHKYFSNFLGTVPTFGFRISISKTSGAKILLRTDCRKYENLIESHYF